MKIKKSSRVWIDMDLGTSCARRIAEDVMIALQMDNAHDFRTRDKLINVINPYLTQIMDAVDKSKC